MWWHLDNIANARVNELRHPTDLHQTLRMILPDHSEWKQMRRQSKFTFSKYLSHRRQWKKPSAAGCAPFLGGTRWTWKNYSHQTSQWKDSKTFPDKILFYSRVSTRISSHESEQWRGLHPDNFNEDNVPHFFRQGFRGTNHSQTNQPVIMWRSRNLTKVAKYMRPARHVVQ